MPEPTSAPVASPTPPALPPGAPAGAPVAPQSPDPSNGANGENGAGTFVNGAKPVAPDTAAAPREGTVAHRAQLVKAALRVVADARSVPTNQEVLAAAFDHLQAIGLCETPLIAAYQKPSLFRKEAESKATSPQKNWEVASWADDVVKALFHSARQGYDEYQRSRALDVAVTLLKAYKASHPSFVQEQFPKLREVALTANYKDQWTAAATALDDLGDTRLVSDLVTMVVDKRTVRAIEILSHIQHKQVVSLLTHANADVRQLVVRFVEPGDIQNAMATPNEAVRLSMMQGLEKMPVVKGADYSKYQSLLFNVLSEDPAPAVAAAAGRVWIRLDNRLSISHIVRSMPELRGANPQRAAAAASALLRADVAEDLKVAIRAVVERVVNDEKVSQEVRNAVRAVLTPARPVPARSPVRAGSQAPKVVAAAPSAPPKDPVLVEWAERSAALIEGGGLLTILQGRNHFLVFDAILKISRAWADLGHLRSDLIALHLRHWVETLLQDSEHQLARQYMLAWALRLDPKATMPVVMRYLSEDNSTFRITAIFVLAKGDATVPEVQVGRKLVVDQFLQHMQAAQALTTFDYDVMGRAASFADMMIPRLSILLRWIRAQSNATQDAPLRALDGLAKECDEPMQAIMQREIAAAELGVADIYILMRLGSAGVTRMAELAEESSLGFDERRLVIDALVKRGDAAHPELVDLLSSETPDARMMATISLVWGADVSADDLVSVLSEAPEALWRLMSERLITNSGLAEHKFHFLRDNATTPENLPKQVALARVMAAQLVNPESPAYRKEIAAQYFKYLQVPAYSYGMKRAIKIMAVCLPYEELREMAEAYLLKNKWDGAVVSLYEAWQGTADPVHRALIVKNLQAIGDQLIEDIFSGRVAKNFMTHHQAVMQILVPYVREGLLQQAPRNPKAVIAWAEQMEYEGAALIEGLTQHEDPKVKKAAQRAAERMGRAFLGESGRTSGFERMAPEAAFRVFESVVKK